MSILEKKITCEFMFFYESSVAGLIMAVAFSGLIFSNSASLNQMGFILCVSVLLDTFLFRIFFVPALISLFGELNFWPSKQPAVTKSIETEPEWRFCVCCSSSKSKGKEYQLVN